MTVAFSDVDDEHVRNSFLQVLQQFRALHPFEILLKQESVKSSTMQAQPIIKPGELFSKQQKYQIKLAVNLKDSQNIKVSDLPEDVLKGWFAHELGHLVDYLPYSKFQMIGYGLKYLYWPKFKKLSEHTADHIAIANGFHEEIISTKRYILEHDLLKERYKKTIRKYYLSIEEVKLCMAGKLKLKPAFQQIYS